MKCDETRPQCLKCVKAKRQCDGYPAHKRSGEAPPPIAPRPEGALAISSAPGASAAAASFSSPMISRAVILKNAQRALQIQKIRSTPPPSPKIEYLPAHLSFDTQEGQYFQVFRTRTANELSGFFDSEFWTRSVLQESHSEASIRHAVIALGALYKTLEAACESPPTSPNENTVNSAPNHYNFALQQYGKALTRLRESLENNETRSERTVLISIVLFTCFQSFTGDHKAAIFQIQTGLGLLEDRRQESKQSLIHRRGDFVEDELVQIFTRLAIQAKSYDMAFHFPAPYVIHLTPKSNNPASPPTPSSPSATSTASQEDPHIPERFANSREARSALDSLCERIMRFNEALSSFYSGPDKILPSSIKSSGQGFRTHLQQWSVAFEPLLQTRRRPGITNTERAGINVLKMTQLMITMLFLMSFSTSEMDFDNFSASFREIIELAKEVVVDEELTLAQARCGDLEGCRHRSKRHVNETHFPGITTRAPIAYQEEDPYSHIKASFALDLGIVPPLFVVATKCRERKLRREAIRLLMSSPRREGMWDSTLCGKVGEWIMEVEEEGLGPFDPLNPISYTSIVTNDKRVMVKEILFDMQKREAVIRCGTRGGREGFDMRARETQIFW